MQRKPALINFLCISACCLLNTALCGSRFNIDLNNTVRRKTRALPLQPRAGAFRCRALCMIRVSKARINTRYSSAVRS